MQSVTIFCSAFSFFELLLLLFFIIAHIWGRTPAALLSCPQWTTGRRLYTTAPLAGPSHMGGASDERRENVNNMPERSSETEIEAGSSDRQQRDRGTAPSRNVVSLISQLADDNLTLVRVGGSLCGLLMHVGGHGCALWITSVPSCSS